MNTKSIALAALLCMFLAAPLEAFANKLIANRSLISTKSDQSKGIPSIYNPPASSRHFKQFSQYLTMDDGTKIAVEIYLPQPLKSGTRLPTIYEQSRYWRVIKPRYPLNLIYPKPLSLYRSEFLSHGYAWVVSDARGAGASFGDRPWELMPLDVTDSKQIVDWIVKQSWCDGKIGLIGHSYSGNMAEFSLLNKQPMVKAAAVLSSSFDLYADVLRPGGMPLQPFISQWIDLNRCFDTNVLPKNLSKLRPIVRSMKPVDEDKGGILLKQAIAQHSENSKVDLDKINFRDDTAIGHDGRHTQTHDRCLAMLKERFGESFLKRGVDLSSPSGYWREIDASAVPIYAGAGWLDGANSNAAVKRFLNYRSAGTKLILGPWDHDFINISPFSRGGFSRFRVDREMLKFFDCHLKGIGPLEKDLPVHYFTLGQEEWHGSKTWPPENRPAVYYLGAKHSLSKTASDSGFERYNVDDRTGSGKDGRWDCLLGNILLDPYPDRKKQDRLCLCFDSEQLEDDMVVSGSPSVNISIRTSGKDCSLFCYLEDIWPNGSVHYVTEGEVLCGDRLNAKVTPLYKTVLPQRSFRASDYSTLEQGKVTRVDLELLPMSYLFKKGHRLRLSIAGQDRDHFKGPGFVEVSREFDVEYGDKSLISLPVEVSR